MSAVVYVAICACCKHLKRVAWRFRGRMPFCAVCKARVTDRRRALHKAKRWKRVIEDVS